MSKHQVSQRQIALQSDVSPSTINRALDEDGDFVMSWSIITKIEAAFGEPSPSSLDELAARPNSFSDGDLADVGGTQEQERSEEGVRRWRVSSLSLNLAGFQPGDLVEFATDVRPKQGDYVAAQVRNIQTGQAEMVFRLFHPPYLLTRTTEATMDIRPLYVDDERVRVVGTWQRMTRERAA